MNFLSDLAPYKRGAFQMYLRFKELLEPEGNAEIKAILGLLEDPCARDRFLEGDYEKIGFRNHIRKGKKLISCEAYFAVWDNIRGWHEGSLMDER